MLVSPSVLVEVDNLDNEQIKPTSGSLELQRDKNN